MRLPNALSNSGMVAIEGAERWLQSKVQKGLQIFPGKLKAGSDYVWDS